MESFLFSILGIFPSPRLWINPRPLLPFIMKSNRVFFAANNESFIYLIGYESWSYWWIRPCLWQSLNDLNATSRKDLHCNWNVIQISLEQSSTESLFKTIDIKFQTTFNKFFQTRNPLDKVDQNRRDWLWWVSSIFQKEFLQGIVKIHDDDDEKLTENSFNSFQSDSSLVNRGEFFLLCFLPWITIAVFIDEKAEHSLDQKREILLAWMLVMKRCD